MTGPLGEICVRTDAQAVAEWVAERTIELLAAALEREAQAVWIAAGGGTPARAYRLLAERRSRVDWDRVVVAMGDERCVSPNDERSNWGQLQRLLGIHYVDIGTSGGVWGRDVGYCMMAGGSTEAIERVRPFLDLLAPPPDPEHGPGWLHVGPSGAGHYVKMVHNGIEYGLMQAYAEGFSLFDASEYRLDNAAIAHLWMQGSVVRSWLCSLAARAFEEEGNDLAALDPYVEDSGEGRWTVEEAIDKRVPTPVITTALYERFASRGQNAFAAKVNAALRSQFGGHAVVRRRRHK